MRDKVSIKEILLAFESVLRIEYKERDIEMIKKLSKNSIENTFQVKLVTDIYTTQASNRLVGDSLEVLLAEITECLKNMSLLVTLSIFDRKYGLTLRDVNYLGFAEDQLLTALRYLQDEVLYEKREAFLSIMIRNASTLEMSLVRRMLTIMFVLENIGVKEGVAIIAQYLYLGAK